MTEEQIARVRVCVSHLQRAQRAALSSLSGPCPTVPEDLSRASDALAFELSLTNEVLIVEGLAYWADEGRGGPVLNVRPTVVL